MLCPNCESENRDDAKFCDECGFPIMGANTRPASASAERDASFQEQFGEDRFADEESPIYSSTSTTVSAHEFDSAFEFDELPGSSAVEAAPAGELPEYPELGATGVLEVEENAPDESDTRVTELPVEDPEWDFEKTATTTMAFDDEDRFAGFAPEASEGDFDFFPDEPPASDAYAEQRGQESGFTMEMPRVESDERPSNRDFRISANESKRPPKAVFAIIGVVVVAVIAAVVTFALGLWGGISVPDVTGMTENDARAKLEESGFSVRSTQVKSDDTEGLVLIMDPSAGSRAAEGSEVIIHIATARFVPDIVGKNYDEASKLLQEAGYENVRYDKVKSADEENVVLSVSPEAGTRAKSSMEIVVGVSEAYRVPDISGLDVTAAQEAITKEGLVPQVVYVDTQEYPEGTVIGTTPESGTKVLEGDYVSINVARARGAELVSLTEQLLAPGGTVTLGGTNFAVDSVDSVTYLGNETVSFQITGRPFATLMGETVFATSQSVQGQVVWSEANEVVSIS